MKGRITLIAIGLFGALSLLVIQFYRVQVVQHDKWNRLATLQHEGRVKEPFRRGTFLSSPLRSDHPEEPQPLVLDVPKYHLHIDPASIPEDHRTTIFNQLHKMVGLPETAPAEFERRSRNRQLTRWLDREKREEILTWWRPFARKHKIARNALFFVRDYQRSHPYGPLLGQVLHTIRDHKDEATEQGVPTGGLEQTYNDVLMGKAGSRWVIHTPRSRLAMGSLIEQAEDGADITLTINHHLQQIAEEEIAIGVKRVQGESGWALVMRPQTGEILALAQYPAFDPTHYRDYFNDPTQIKETLVKAVTYAFEPGSVIKPLTLAIALEANNQLEEPFFTPDEKVPTRNGKVKGRPTPLKDVRCHDYLNLYTGLQKSSNIYPGRIVERMGDKMGGQWYLDRLHDLGFGHPSGIQLPGETLGLIPRPGKVNPNGSLEYSLATPYSLAMGYNLLVNSVQMLRAFATLANGGLLVKPTLVRKIVKGDDTLFDLDQELQQNPPKRVFSEQTVATIVEGIRYVTQEGGSGTLADIPHFTEAGKSGTTEKLVGGKYAKNRHFSSFIGFCPATDPEFVILIAIDEPKKKWVPGWGTTHFGGRNSAPIFRAIGQRSLALVGTEPDDPENDAWAPQVVQLREIYDSWNTTNSP